MIEIPTHPDYIKNSERCKGSEYPCVICGKGIEIRPGVMMVHLVSGNMLALPDEPVEEMSDMGGYPIGGDCLSNHPELKPYAQAMQDDDPDNADDPDYGIPDGF